MRIVRLIALVAVTVLLAIPSILCFLVPVRGVRARWRTRIRRSWAAILLRILRIRIRLCGERPSPPVLFVSNHTGYLDILVLTGATGAVFLSKADVIWWPLVGQLAWIDGTVFVDRANRLGIRRVIDRIRQRLRRGTSVVLFPEGTSTDATGLLPFKTPMFEAVRPATDAQAVPIQPVVLRYRTYRGLPIDDSNRRRVFWCNGDPLLPHFWHILSAPGIAVEVHLLPLRPLEGNRSVYADELHNEMLDCLLSDSG